MKKILMFLLVLVFTVSMFAGAASATAVTGTVTLSSGNLNVRALPSTTSAIIGKLPNGAQVTISSGSNGFYKITFNGKTGYISASFVVNNQANTIVNAAKSAIGVKYVYGGATMSGFDCSG